MGLADDADRTCPKPRRRPAQPAVHDDTARICWLMEEAIAAAFAVPVDELRAPSRRTAAVAFARQSAMYLAHVAIGLSLARSAGYSIVTAPPPPMPACWSSSGATIRPSTGCSTCSKAFAANSRAASTRGRRCGHERQNPQDPASRVRILRSRKSMAFAASILHWRSARSRPNSAAPTSSSMMAKARSPGLPAGAAATAAPRSSRTNCRRASGCAPISRAPI